MSNVRCNDCGYSYNGSMPNCPECGAPNPTMGAVPCRGCGFRYGPQFTVCPECGAPRGMAAPRPMGQPRPNMRMDDIGMTNCPNCGAPITNGYACEYCDTVFPHRPPQAPTVIHHHDAPSQGDEGVGAVAVAAGIGAFIGALLD